VPVRAQNYVTAAPTIATVRAAFGHKFFSSKTNGPASAISRLRKNLYPIDEHGEFKLPSPRTRVIPSGAKRSVEYFTRLFLVLRLRLADSGCQ
jgi:hypothetical protein